MQHYAVDYLQWRSQGYWTEGQAGGKSLCQGGEHIRESEGPTLYRQEVLGPLKAPSRWQFETALGDFWMLQ